MPLRKRFSYSTGVVCELLSFSSSRIDIELCDRSDRVGRRPVIFMGLSGSIASITLFGLSRSLVWALLARSIGEADHVLGCTLLANVCLSAGALSGNIAYTGSPCYLVLSNRAALQCGSVNNWRDYRCDQ